MVYYQILHEASIFMMLKERVDEVKAEQENNEGSNKRLHDIGTTEFLLRLKGKRAHEDEELAKLVDVGLSDVWGSSETCFTRHCSCYVVPTLT